MTTSSATQRKLPSTATIVLAAAGVIAAASAGVAVYRSTADAGVAASSHAAGAPNQAVPSVEQKVAELEARLRRSPEDPEGWRTLGWSYYELGRSAPSEEAFKQQFTKAAGAYRRAAELEPNRAENWSSLGETLQTTTTGVSTEAKAAFERALALDPKDPRARYFLAVQKDLSGAHAAAVDEWVALLKDTPPGAPWEQDLRRTIQQAATKNKIDVADRLPPPSAGSVATAGIPGPTPEQLASASQIPPSQQNEMVQGMVARLEGRLAEQPKDAPGWIRLMRSRMVLGEPDKARTALRSGLAAFKGDSARQAQIQQAATQLGVPSGG